AKGQPLDARGLSARLRPYGVASKNFRVGDQVVKGYTRADLADAWSRYLAAPSSPQGSATSATDATPPDHAPDCGAAPVQAELGYETAPVASVADVAEFSGDEGPEAIGTDTPTAAVCVECACGLPPG